MRSNYDILGNQIRLVDNRNREMISRNVLGINILCHQLLMLSEQI